MFSPVLLRCSPLDPQPSDGGVSLANVSPHQLGEPERPREDAAAYAVGGSTTGRAVLPALKPRLRGWLHAGMAPVALVCGIVLVSLSPSQYRWAAGLYSLTALMLFGVSALYHRFTWSPRVTMLLKRLDHSNIFLIIAGSYTPFAVVLLPGGDERTLLLLVWSGALAGVLFRVFWVRAPR